MKILWTQLALFDLDQAYNYIANISSNRANDIIDRIEQSITLLQQFPEMDRLGRITELAVETKSKVCKTRSISRSVQEVVELNSDMSITPATRLCFAHTR